MDIKEKDVLLDDRSGEFQGPGKGQDDVIKTTLPDGCYIIDAHSVSFLGDGTTDAGVKVLHDFEQSIIKKFYNPQLEQIDQSPATTDIPALLSNGEYQISPLVVTLLGHGDNRRGAHVLDIMIRNLRRHKISNKLALPPKAKSIFAYLPPKWRNHA